MKYALLMYDIQDDKRRTRLFKFLGDQRGIPLQKSVWILRYDRKRGAEVEQWIRKEIISGLEPGDQIHLWPLTNKSISRMKALKSHVDVSFLHDVKGDILVL